MAIQMLDDVGLIVGCFDPFHEGHLDHLLKASKLCRYLIVVTHSDESLIKKRGYFVQTYDIRKSILKGLMMLYGIRGRVEQAIEDIITGWGYNDGIPLTLVDFKPDIFIKGGDRIESNMPQSELEACRENNIRIVYGVGDLLNSSSGIIDRIIKQIQEKK